MLDDAPVVDDEHLVGMTDRGETVGDDKARPAIHQLPERCLNIDFSACINAARRFIEDEDLRIGKDGAGDGKQLPLPFAQIAAAF